MKMNDTILHQQNFKVKNITTLILNVLFKRVLMKHTSIKCSQTTP